MKIRKILAIALTLALAVTALMFNVSAAESAKLSDSAVTIEVGASYQLYVDRATQSISWSSSDKSVATVSNGKVTAKKAGKTTITAKHGKTSLKCNVTVVKKGTAKKETSVTVTNYFLSKDYAGEDVLVIEYDFYNAEKDSESFMLLFDDTVYQNGVECDSFVVGVDEIDSSSKMNKVKPGSTVHVTEGYHIKDKSPVEIEIKARFGNKVYVSKTIKIK